MLRPAQHERDGVVYALTFHPDTPPVAIHRIDATFGIDVLTFRIDGAIPKMPPPARACRTDGLWRTTCFELFVRPIDDVGYYEYNFSPSTAWAAYRFSGYRAGVSDHPVTLPQIVVIDDGVRITLCLDNLPPRPWDIALSAVIEETDGTKSYWALRHPPGPPDFHHPDCFALRIPALADR